MSTTCTYGVKTTFCSGQGQTADHYHATVRRLEDGVELIFTARWNWRLMRKTRRKQLDKEFARYDKDIARIREGSRTLER